MRISDWISYVCSSDLKAFPSLFDGIAREHSRKPEEWYRIIDDRFPNVLKIDVFSRQSRPGWLNWGKQKTLFDAGDPASLRREAPVSEGRELEPMPLFEPAA